MKVDNEPTAYAKEQSHSVLQVTRKYCPFHKSINHDLIECMTKLEFPYQGDPKHGSPNNNEKSRV